MARAAGQFGVTIGEDVTLMVVVLNTLDILRCYMSWSCGFHAHKWIDPAPETNHFQCCPRKKEDNNKTDTSTWRPTATFQESYAGSAVTVMISAKLLHAKFRAILDDFWVYGSGRLQTSVVKDSLIAFKTIYRKWSKSNMSFGMASVDINRTSDSDSTSISFFSAPQAKGVERDYVSLLKYKVLLVIFGCHLVSFGSYLCWWFLVLFSCHRKNVAHWNAQWCCI